MKEGRVGLKEEVAEANCKLLGLENLFKGREATDEFYPGGVMVGTAKDDMMSHMMVKSRPMSGMRVSGAWACSDVFSSRMEMVRVIHIETVCNCKAKEGRGDEMMSHSDGALYARRGFVIVRGHAGDMRGVVGRGIIHKEFLPHSLFGCGVVI